MAPPLPPRSFGIIVLGGDSRQIFGFKGVAGKVFQNQQLTLSKSAENGFGAVSRAERSFASLRISAAGSPLRLRSGSPPLDASTSKLPQSDLNRHARRVLSQWISITDGCDEKGQIWERIVSAEFSIATWGGNSNRPRAAGGAMKTRVATAFGVSSRCRYFAAGDSSRPLYFNIAFVLGGAPRQASYILPRS